MFHEAPVWYPPTDEVFFCQNAGAKAAGTGLNRSSVLQKVSVPEAVSVSHLRDATGHVKVEVVPFDPPVINPNGKLNGRSFPRLISPPISLRPSSTLRSYGKPC